MNKRAAKNASSFSLKIKLASIAIFLALSLGLLIGIMQTPQDIRQRAQNTPARVTTPPQCASSGGQPDSGVCVATTDGCLKGEEQDEGQLDCAAGQTCCSLAEVPQQCAGQSNGQTFCSIATNCTGLYNGQPLAQFDCEEGTICCKNPTFPTLTPTPPEAPEPTTAEDPTPTFGSISGPNDDPVDPTQAPNPQEQPPQQQPAQPGQQDGGLLQIILLLIGLILSLLGR